MNEPDRPSGVPPEEWATRKLEAEIAEFQNLVEDATVAEVDEPTGRKEVEIAWEDEDGFHSKEGEAFGVYRQYTDTREASSYTVDWVDGSRTIASADSIVTLQESEYYTE